MNGAKRSTARRGPVTDTYQLVAVIEQSIFSYYVSEARASDDHLTDDEAILDVSARIEQISAPYKNHLHQLLDISLVTAQRFRERKPEAPPAALHTLALRKDHRGFLSYLPRDAFWALLPRLENGSLGVIEVRFERLLRGSGAIASLYFRPPDGDQATPPS